MTQQLTIEQLKFARSIGATRYLKGGFWNGPEDSYFFYRDGLEWADRCWLPFSGDLDDESFPPIDFSPLDDLEAEYVPKVGEECEMYMDDHGWINVKPVGEDEGEYVYKLEIPTGDGFEIKYMKCSSCKFRPLPTEEEVDRDNAIKHMASIHAAHQWTPEQFSEALYDAGYRLQESE